MYSMKRVVPSSQDLGSFTVRLLKGEDAGAVRHSSLVERAALELSDY